MFFYSKIIITSRIVIPTTTKPFIFFFLSLNRSVIHVVKTLDEERSKFTSIPSLFNEEIIAKRKNLISSIENILFEEFEVIGRKSRDLLWRKVYYDPISIAKKLCKKNAANSQDDDISLLINFIKDAIKHYKTLILKFEDLFSLDLRFIIDFSIIANGADGFEKKSEKEIYTVSEMNHAMETIHAFLVCLGDLHRYCIEFNFAEKDVSINTSKELASKYYVEAFKLNPKIGMPHNQLGTLCAGQNYEVDSIFHYLYSLCSPFPFELSEANVNRVFQQNIEALEQMEQVGDGCTAKDFIMQMVLVIDIFFYDKEIGEFNTLCRTVLVSFKEYLNINKGRRDRHRVDLTFQLTSILMLCLLKLKLKNSPKVHSLNAFLVAFCAEIIEVTIRKVGDFISDHKEENLKFSDVYNKKFTDFDKKIKNTREMTRGIAKEKAITIMKNADGERNGSTNNSQRNGHSSNQLSIESKPTSDEASGKSDPTPITIVKKPLPTTQQPASHNRRRRRRCKVSGSTNSSDESETESLASDSDDNVTMNSDFDSYDEQDDDFSDRYSSDEEENGSDRRRNGASDSDNDDDLVIENEEIVYANGTEKLTNGVNNAYKFREEAHENSSDDFVIEQEQFVYPEGEEDETIMRLKYKKKYMKDDPNLIIRFNEANVSCMKSLKLLFDWLRLNQEILVGCYRSNPEFITKIMTLINFLNIDIFTRKIYFDRSLLTVKNVRENLRYLFDIRQQIATDEDIVFKKCVMFEELQRPLDWELNYKLQITPEEDIILRNFKIIDFGFSLCKLKKFSYNFCARSRMFIEKTGRRRMRGQRRGSDERGTVKKSSRRRDRRRNRGRKKTELNCENFERMTIKKHHEENQEVEEYPSIEQSHQRNFRKGYLKSKLSEKLDKESEALNIKQDNAKQIDMKNELMGKLWLKSEIQSLESKKHSSVALTPYIMLDSNCLTDYLYIVKNLVKSKKFVVLIPKAGKSINELSFKKNA